MTFINLVSLHFPSKYTGSQGFPYSQFPCSATVPPTPWSKIHKYLHQHDIPFTFSLFLTQTPVQNGNEFGYPRSHEKPYQISACLSEIFLFCFFYRPLLKRVHSLRQRLSNNSIPLSGKLILHRSKFIASISKQTTEATTKATEC